MTAVWIARVLELIPAGLRQYIPLHGLFADEWPAPTALAFFWFESVLLVLVAGALCWRLRRRVSDAAIDAARARGDVAGARALEAEQLAANRAGIHPRDVLIFHLGSLFVFGGFLGGVLVILIGNGHVDPIDWPALRSGASAMMLVVALGFALEMVVAPTMDARAVQARVDACLGRWGLLWLLGFGGTFAMAFTGSGTTLFAWFAVLKAVWEGWSLFARLFGWTSLNDRKAEAEQVRVPDASEIDVE